MNSIYYVLHYVDSPCKWTDTQKERERGREEEVQRETEGVDF